jgi:hypothetical protein
MVFVQPRIRRSPACALTGAAERRYHGGMKRFFPALGMLLVAALALALLAERIGLTWSEKELFTQTQPEGMVYDAFGPYAVAVLKRRHTVTTEYAIRIAKTREPGTGCMLELPEQRFDPASPPRVTWTVEGVEIQLEYGDTLTVPKRHFAGGR